ncbi:MAG TPA: PilT/PilU family type 4a pilus ATPase [Verrucomicrobiae bacterium]|nr:PilT/PilU family type 4a pilus ATPase [Verrucomicrobiae bacterium]
MGDPKSTELFGRIAVHLKLITMDQLAEAIREQAVEGGQLGELLIRKGVLTPDGLQKILAYQKEYLAKQAAAGAAGAAKPTAPKGKPAGPAKPATGKVGASTAPLPAATVAEVAASHPSEAAAARPADAVAARRQDAPAARPPATPGAARAGTAAQPGGQGFATQPPRDRRRLDALLAKAVERRASDLHVHAGAPVKLRLNGELLDDAPAPLPAPEAEAILLGGLEPEQAALFDQHGELDFAYTIPNVGRFRANVYRQHRGMNGIFRVIPPAPPTLQELGLPATLARVVNFHQGLVLLTGPAGCGKSSTLAALVDILNTERRDHILTIEDPIEHLHPSKRCVVNQRQAGRHTESFARALRAALREDPDIIVIGELRDRETISLALTAAETGHLVLGTLHTNSAIRTINRILGVFPPNQQSQIRTMISESLKAIVSQRLIRTTDGKRRVPALEILMCNKAVGNLIREGKTFQIISVLQTGGPQGMALMENSLAALVKSGTISKDEALKLCDDPKRLVA